MDYGNEDQIRLEQVRLLYRLQPVGLVATVVNGLIVTALHLPLVPSSVLLSWISLLTAFAFIRALLSIPARGEVGRGKRIKFWANIFAGGMLVTGIIWGSAAFFQYYHDSQPHAILVAYVLGGMIAGAAATFSTNRLVFLMFSIPAALPQIVLFFLSGDMVNVAMGAMLTFFWVLVTASALTNRSTTLASISLRFEKENLISSLRKANNETLSANQMLTVEIERRKEVEQQLRSAQAELEKKVKMRTGELEIANRRLEEANRELSDFTHSVSHDLRAPLAGIESFQELLEDEFGGALNDSARGYLSLIRNSTERMKELIEDLLVLSRVDKSELVPTEIDMSALAEEIIADLQKRSKGRKVEIRIRPGITTRGDFRLIRIAMENLLDNAWKYTGKTETPIIEFGERSGGDTQEFFIKDNGAGFDMAYADNLFVPFKRLHSSSSFPGTGIGLTTVQRIMRRHGGEIRAQSEPGKGATFTFSLPMQ